jgi:hypothetical protein
LTNSSLNISLLFRKFNCFKSYQQTSYLIEKAFTHTHTLALYELSNLFKISICREICAFWILNSQLYLCIFLKCYLTTLSVDYTCVFWSYFWEIYFVCKFSSSFRFSVWSVWMNLLLCPDACGLVVRTVKWHVQTRVVLLIANLAKDSPVECVPRPDAIFTVFFFAACFLCHSHCTTLFSYFCHVVCFSRDFGILCTSLFIPWFLLYLPLFF